MGSRDLSGNEEYVRRFSAYRIVEHLALIALFVVLTATGLPQKFYSLGVSQAIIIAMGGIDNVRFFHHVAGALFTVLTVQHVVATFVGVFFLHWEPSMLITFKDAHDAIHNVRYYLGLVDRPAMCGRYNYKEKCVYWLILSGGIQMIFTGFVLWFPVVVTKYIPGQFIPASKAIHTNEAMLIFLLIATWHIYASMFTPGVFPLNKSIFTGYLEKGRMEQEHPLELAQLMEEGEEEPHEPGVGSHAAGEHLSV